MRIIKDFPANEKAPLYKQYEGQHEAQPAYIEYSMDNDTLRATFDSTIGPGVPAAVFHGRTIRFKIDNTYSGEALSEILDFIKPTIEETFEDSRIVWNHSNHIGKHEVHVGEEVFRIEQMILEKFGDKEQRVIGVNDLEDFFYSEKLELIGLSYSELSIFWQSAVQDSILENHQFGCDFDDFEKMVEGWKE